MPNTQTQPCFRDGSKANRRSGCIRATKVHVHAERQCEKQSTPSASKPVCSSAAPRERAWYVVSPGLEPLPVIPANEHCKRVRDFHAAIGCPACAFREHDQFARASAALTTGTRNRSTDRSCRQKTSNVRCSDIMRTLYGRLSAVTGTWEQNFAVALQTLRPVDAGEARCVREVVGPSPAPPSTSFDAQHVLLKFPERRHGGRLLSRPAVGVQQCDLMRCRVSYSDSLA